MGKSKHNIEKSGNKAPKNTFLDAFLSKMTFLKVKKSSNEEEKTLNQELGDCFLNENSKHKPPTERFDATITPP